MLAGKGQEPGPQGFLRGQGLPQGPAQWEETPNPGYALLQCTVQKEVLFTGASLW